MNEIVNYDKCLNRLRIRNLKAIEMDLFMSLCKRLSESDTNTVVITFSELKKIIVNTEFNYEKFIGLLKSASRKLIDIFFEAEMDRKIIASTLFPIFEIDLFNETLTVCVNENYHFIYQAIINNFTKLELQEFSNLGSKYSKNLYRLLKQFRKTGKCEISIMDFRQKIDCPESYSNKYVMDLIIKPSVQELQKYFQDLKCKPRYAKQRGNPVIGYTFTYLAVDDFNCKQIK